MNGKSKKKSESKASPSSTKSSETSGSPSDATEKDKVPSPAPVDVPKPSLGKTQNPAPLKGAEVQKGGDAVKANAEIRVKYVEPDDADSQLQDHQMEALGKKVLEIPRTAQGGV